jgi:peptidoglycan/xylan/chitin deacetylase (PgdA/CDA1 family)
MTEPGPLPILTYHAIDLGRGPTSTDPSRFADTLDALLGAGFQAVDLGEWIDAGRPVVSKGFAIAFDDGLRSILGVADRLARLAIPATVFLPSARIGTDNDWLGQPRWVPRARILDRSDLCSLTKLGFRFGSHGRTHRRLDRLSPLMLRDELAVSRDEVEQAVGARCPLIAYPYGSASPKVREAVAKVYEAGFGTRLAYASVADDPFDIARIDAFYLRTRGAIDRLIAGRWRGRLAFRRALRAVRSTVEMAGSG